VASSETAERAADAAADAADAAAAATDANQEDIEKEKWRVRSADGSGKSEAFKAGYKIISEMQI
jgi:hypothetical protein